MAGRRVGLFPARLCLIMEPLHRLWRRPSPAHMFLSAIPTVLAAYIVVFGDVLQANAVLKEADHVRTDEAVVYNPSRAHLLFGGRNMLMSIFGPDVAMCGPLWAAMHVVIVERYKQGHRAMQSIFGGEGSFRWGSITGLFLLPITSFVEPILPVGLALTLIIQGFGPDPCLVDT